MTIFCQLNKYHFADFLHGPISLLVMHVHYYVIPLSQNILETPPPTPPRDEAPPPGSPQNNILLVTSPHHDLDLTEVWTFFPCHHHAPFFKGGGGGGGRGGEEGEGRWREGWSYLRGDHTAMCGGRKFSASASISYHLTIRYFPGYTARAHKVQKEET